MQSPGARARRRGGRCLINRVVRAPVRPGGAAGVDRRAGARGPGERRVARCLPAARGACPPAAGIRSHSRLVRRAAGGARSQARRDHSAGGGRAAGGRARSRRGARRRRAGCPRGGCGSRPAPAAAAGRGNSRRDAGCRWTVAGLRQRVSALEDFQSRHVRDRQLPRCRRARTRSMPAPSLEMHEAEVALPGDRRSLRPRRLLPGRLARAGSRSRKAS